MADEDDPHRLDAGVQIRRHIEGDRESYQKRVADEHDALKLKVDALHNFIQGAAFDTVNPNEQPLIKIQYNFMRDYMLILEQRIALHRQG